MIGFNYRDYVRTHICIWFRTSPSCMINALIAVLMVNIATVR